jgi:hypothetical protein
MLIPHQHFQISDLIFNGFFIVLSPAQEILHLEDTSPRIGSEGVQNFGLCTQDFSTGGGGVYIMPHLMWGLLFSGLI